MQIDQTRYIKKEKAPPHEKAATVNLFKEFIGGFSEEYPFAFWLRKVGKCSYSDALDIIKSLETLPVEYNKAGVIINKLKKFNASSKR